MIPTVCPIDDVLDIYVVPMFVCTPRSDRRGDRGMEMEDKKQDQKCVSEKKQEEQTSADPHWDGSGD